MHPGNLSLHIAVAICAAALLFSAILLGKQSKDANQGQAAFDHDFQHMAAVWNSAIIAAYAVESARFASFSPRAARSWHRDLGISRPADFR